MKFTKLLIAVALFACIKANALEKPEGPAVDPSTASLEKDVAQIKAEGKLGPIAARGRAESTKLLADRVLALGLIQNRTPEQEAEFKAKKKELESHMRTMLPK